MLALDPAQKSSTLPVEAINTSDDYCAVAKIAIHAIRVLGAILMAAGIGCIVTGFQVPPIALLVMGVAALILGFVLGKDKEKNSVVLPETIVSEMDSFSEKLSQETTSNPLLDPSEELNPILPSDLTEAAAALLLQHQETLEEINDLPKPGITSFFGKEEWIEHIGDPGKLPPLPADIETILKQPCPFWDGKTVAETHMLVLIPETVTQIVGDEPRTLPLTLENFKKVVKFSNCKAKAMVQQGFAKDDLEKSSPSHWILMTKDALPKNSYKSYAEAKQRIGAAGYEIPSCLDVATAILLQNIRFGKDHTSCCLENEFGQKSVIESVIGREPNLQVQVYRIYSPYIAELHGIVAMHKF